MAEHPKPAREATADGPRRQVGSGGDFEQILCALDDERDGSALGVEPRHDMVEDVLLRL